MLLYIDILRNTYTYQVRKERIHIPLIKFYAADILTCNKKYVLYQQNSFASPVPRSPKKQQQTKSNNNTPTTTTKHSIGKKPPN